MPEYTQNDLPLIRACIDSVNLQMDHADAEIALWEKFRTDASRRWQFWTDIEQAIKKVENK